MNSSVFFRVCTRWRQVAHDKTLWQQIKLDQPVSLKKMWKFVRCHLNEMLVSLMIQGFLRCAHSLQQFDRNISDAILKDLASRCQNLSKLYLHSLNLSHVKLESFPRSLKTLSLIGSLLPFGWFKDMHEKNILPKIQKLDVAECSTIRDRDLSEIANNCKSLHVLRLNNCYRITPIGLQKILFGLPALTELAVSGLRMINPTLRALEGHKKLEILNFSLVEQVSDAWVISMTKMASLHTIYLAGCKNITDEGLRNFYGMRQQIVFLDVRNTMVTSKGVKDLKIKFPHCKICCT